MKDIQISFYRNACEDIAAEIKIQNDRVFSSERGTQVALALYLIGAVEFAFVRDEKSAVVPIRPDTFSFVPEWAWEGFEESAFWLQLTAGIMHCCTMPVYDNSDELRAVRARLPSYLVDEARVVRVKDAQHDAQPIYKKVKQYGRAV